MKKPCPWRFLLLLMGVLLAFCTASRAQSSPTLALGPLPGTTFIVGTPFVVPFTASGTYAAGNVFAVQLFNAGSTFTIDLASLAATAPGTYNISVTLPATISAGSNYRLRVVSSQPVIMSADNGTNLTITRPAADPSWTQRANFGGGARSDAVSFTLGSKAYVGTGSNYAGFTGFNVDLNDFWAYDSTAGTWTQVASLGTHGRTRAVGFSIGNKGYVGGGFGQTGPRTRDIGTVSDFWSYDPILNRWNQRANIPAGENAVGFGLNGKGYVGTTSSNNFWSYDPDPDVWTRKADFPGLPRRGAVGFALDNRGYIGTGSSSSGNLQDFWAYDPTADTWTRKADFAGGPRYEAVGVGLGNTGYVGTGSNNTTGYLQDFWAYNASTDTWTRKPDFGGVARANAVGFALGARVYLGTGLNNSPSIFLADIWSYKPDVPTLVTGTLPGTTFAAGASFAVPFTATGTFATGNVFTAQLSDASGSFGQALVVGSVAATASGTYSIPITLPTSLPTGSRYRLRVVASQPATAGSDNGADLTITGAPTPAATWTRRAYFGGGTRAEAVGFSIGEFGYVGTGMTGTSSYPNYGKSSDWWAYNPTTDTWTQKADVPGSPRFSAVGFSVGSMGYLGTGFYFDNLTQTFLQDFYAYDPAANTWARKADFPGGARYQAIGFGLGNLGYVGLGSGPLGAPTPPSDFWAYDPAADTWTRKADFPGRGRSVGFSVASRGYVGAGSDSNDFWAYDPTTNTWMRKADIPGLPRNEAVGFGLNGKGYVGTGRYTDPNNFISTALQDLWGYDPTTDTWMRQPDFAGGPRYSAVGFSIGNKGYVGLGIRSNADNSVQTYLADFWAFDPTAVTLATASSALTREISLYPNPAHSTVRLQFPSRLAQQGMQVSVVNTLGQVVLQQVMLPSPSTMRQLALPTLAKGVYLVRLSTAEGVVAKRLVIN